MSPLIIPVGLVIGLSLGALGGGGSILTVPALVYLLGEDPRQATASSLVIVGVTALIALVPHWRRGNVRLGQGITFGVLGTAGSFAGSAAAVNVAPEVLLLAFAALMLLVAVLMFRRSRSSGEDGESERGTEPTLRLRPLNEHWPRIVKLLLTASIVGLLTGFFGVGGGFALVPALVLALSLPMTVAVGTSLLVIAINSSTALLARAGSGMHLDWPVIAAFTAAAVVGSLIGGRAAARVPAHVLTRTFAALLVVVATYTAVSTLA